LGGIKVERQMKRARSECVIDMPVSGSDKRGSEDRGFEVIDLGVTRDSRENPHSEAGRSIRSDQVQPDGLSNS
jgi:hypothetical protein